MSEIISRSDARQRGLKHFFTGEPCKYGHIAARFTKGGGCMECNRLKASETYHRDPAAAQKKQAERHKANPHKKRADAQRWREENPEKHKDNGRAYYLANQERIKKRSREWSARNRAAKNAYNKAWNEANKERAREHQRTYDRKRLKTDPVYAMMARMQSAIRNSLIKGGYTKRSRTYEYLGCSYEQFKEHIERQFLKGMTWENRDQWHIDHITPTSSAKTEAEMAALHHFTNLRPLWARDNQSKGDKIEYLI